MRKSKTHLQKKYAINAIHKACLNSDKRVENILKSTKAYKEKAQVSSEISCAALHCQQALDMNGINEVYFEILGFEQSSAIQIVSSYANSYHIDLKLGSNTLSNNNKDLSLQEYGIIAKGDSQNLQNFFNVLESLFGDRLIKGDISTFLVKKLQQNKQTICVAESCTGGVLSSMITAVNGASYVFKGGITTYSIESKQQILGIKDSIIKEHSVYSEACVRAMARGVIDLFQADIAISTSGLATQDTSSNNFLNLPEGVVFTCVLIRDRLPVSISHNYLSHTKQIEGKNSRIFVQKEASLQALRLLLGILSN